MGDKTVSVRVRFEGGDQVKAGLQEVGREGSRAMTQVETSTNRMGSSLQNAGFQISDFFVQVSSGTAPSRALAQQLPQLLQGFGLIGVAASVLVAALPSVWSLFGSGADEAELLEKQLEGVKSSTDAYASAAAAAMEPIERLRAKYGELAESVKEARIQQAELARGDASRAVNSLLTGTGPQASAIGASNADLAQIVALEQGYARIRALQDSLTPEQARVFDFSADLAALDQIAGRMGETRQALVGMAQDYGVTVEQAALLAAQMDRVRDSAGRGAAEQVAAASALRDKLIEIYGSADAANEATNGLVDALNLAVQSAADVAATDMAGPIGAAAGNAATLATNLAAAAANYSALSASTGLAGPDAVRARTQFGMTMLDGKPVTPGVFGAGLPSISRDIARGGGGAGGSDPDLARAKALTEGVRTETEKYAIALEEVNRLKARGLITDDTYSRQIDKLNEKLGETGDLGKQAASAIRGAFDNLFDDPQKALQDLSRQLAMMALYQGLARGLPSIFGGGGVLPLGIPGFAAGGRHRGGLRIVGENGPELEATGPSMIYPNEALRGLGRGGGGTQVIINNNTSAPVTQEQRRGPNGQEFIDVSIGQSIQTGRQDKALQGRFGVKPQRTVR